MGPDQGNQVCKSNNNSRNNKGKATRSDYFVAQPAVKGKNLVPPEAEFVVQEAVEGAPRDVQYPADAGEVDVRVEPDPVRLHQAEKGGERALECKHGRYVL